MYTATVKFSEQDNQYYIELQDNPFNATNLVEWIKSDNGGYTLMEVTPETSRVVLSEFRSELRNLLKTGEYTIEQQATAEEIWQLLHDIADRHLVSEVINLDTTD